MNRIIKRLHILITILVVASGCLSSGKPEGSGLQKIAKGNGDPYTGIQGLMVPGRYLNFSKNFVCANGKAPRFSHVPSYIEVQSDGETAIYYDACTENRKALDKAEYLYSGERSPYIAYQNKVYQYFLSPPVDYPVRRATGICLSNWGIHSTHQFIIFETQNGQEIEVTELGSDQVILSNSAQFGSGVHTEYGNYVRWVGSESSLRIYQNHIVDGFFDGRAEWLYQGGQRTEPVICASEVANSYRRLQPGSYALSQEDCSDVIQISADGSVKKINKCKGTQVAISSNELVTSGGFSQVVAYQGRLYSDVKSDPTYRNIAYCLSDNGTKKDKDYLIFENINTKERYYKISEAGEANPLFSAAAQFNYFQNSSYGPGVFVGKDDVGFRIFSETKSSAISSFSKGSVSADFPFGHLQEGLICTILPQNL